VKVEHALRILPRLEALLPLRELLLSTSASEHGGWAGSARNLTIGRREVAPGKLRRGIAQGIERSSAHLTALYECYVRAVEAIESDRHPAAAAELLKAGLREERAGRHAHAREWYSMSLDVASGLQNRRPEVEALLALGRIDSAVGVLAPAARHFQRALALAEAEFDDEGVMQACEGLGGVEATRRSWTGAQAWLSRALRTAEQSRDGWHVGRVRHALGDLARRAGQLRVATAELRLARDSFEAQPSAESMARVLESEALVLADLRRPTEAAAAYREALAWAWRILGPSEAELGIRLNFARLHADTAGYLEAEEEARKAEQIALTCGNVVRLVEVYTLLGRLRGIQRDESGFVFFEQAIELVATLDGSHVLEADVYHEYAAFKYALGQPAESEAYSERAREIFTSSGAAS
jgi:tetratricopeptide (TPR) repeat protein